MEPKEEYIAFCTENWVPLFHRPFWWDLVLDDWQVKVFENEIGEYAFLPHASYKKMGFSFSRNPFLTPYSGLVYSKEITNEQKITFISKAEQFLTQFSISAYNSHPHFHKRISHNKQGTTFLLDVNKPYQDICAAYSSNIKRQLKKANKNLEIIEDQDATIFYSCYADSMKKNKAPELVPKDLIEAVYQTTHNNIESHLFTAYAPNKIAHASIWYIADEQYGYYLLGGSKQEYLGSGAMATLIDHCIQTAASNNKKIFDFEGSENPGVAQFFAKFGGSKTSYPILSAPTNPKLKLLLKLKRLITK